MNQYIASFRTGDAERAYVSQCRVEPDGLKFWIGNMYRERAFCFDSVESARGALYELHYGPDRSCVFQVYVLDGVEQSRRVWPLSPLEELARVAE